MSKIRENLERNERLLRHLEASSDSRGQSRQYADLLEAADALEVRYNSPTLVQLEEVKQLLLEQRDAIDRLLKVIEPAIEQLKESE